MTSRVDTGTNRAGAFHSYFQTGWFIPFLFFCFGVPRRSTRQEQERDAPRRPWRGATDIRASSRSSASTREVRNAWTSERMPPPQPWRVRPERDPEDRRTRRRLHIRPLSLTLLPPTTPTPRPRSRWATPKRRRCVAPATAARRRRRASRRRSPRSSGTRALSPFCEKPINHPRGEKV